MSQKPAQAVKLNCRWCRSCREGEVDDVEDVDAQVAAQPEVAAVVRDRRRAAGRQPEQAAATLLIATS